MWKWIKRLVRFILVVAFAAAAFTLACSLWVTGSTAHRVFSEVSEVPYRPVALLLGTSKRVVGGDENLHFTHRMEAAAALFREGKVDHILVSGDGAGDEYYDESGDMLEALVALGVPASAITRDELGVRTFDSVIHAGESWGLSTFTVVSDGFHVSRAVFIADQRGFEDVIAFASMPVVLEKSLKSRGREWLARVAAVLDTTVLETRAEHAPDPSRGPIVVRRRGEVVTGEQPGSREKIGGEGKNGDGERPASDAAPESGGGDGGGAD